MSEPTPTQKAAAMASLIAEKTAGPTPRTAAGRALHENMLRGAVFVRLYDDEGLPSPDYAADHILAIEAEARAAALDAATWAVMNAPRQVNAEDVDVLDALAAIDALRERSGE